MPVSFGVHALFFALLWWLAGSTERPAGHEATFEVDLIEEFAQDEEEEDEVEAGGSAAEVGAGQPAPTLERSAARPVRMIATQPVESESEPSSEQPIEHAGGVVDLDTALGGGGLGGSAGHGRGRGAGDGDGTGLVPKIKRVKTTLPPAPSKARPARLIWPTRFRKDRADRLFVVKLNVDDDGMVTGVKLVRGVEPHINGKALEAVWRFRYDPARDREGRKIASVVIQKFMLNW